MPTLHDANLEFLTSKGFDIKSPDDLKKALHWLQVADGDDLMYGEPSGDDFDKMVGEMRRPMLIETVHRTIRGASFS